MGLTTTQGFNFKLVANGEILDLFANEDILLSDNVTGLFDLGILPADFTRQLSLPGTKKNNAFFEHVYDISIVTPDLFATNQKVSCYLDFDGIYLAQGYLQLNKVNVLANKFIDSYEVSIYGAVSSFAKTINRTFLTQLNNLGQYSHTSSYDNISASWAGELFNGDIVYPLADYGSGFKYTSGDAYFGIDDNEGGLSVQDFKPAIRVKALWDKVFEFAGVTYTGSFFEEPFLDDVYMICNNSLKYPEYSGVDLENYGVVKITPISATGQTDLVIAQDTSTRLPWYNVEKDPSSAIGSNTSYIVKTESSLRGILNLELELSGSLGGPVIELRVIDAFTFANVSTTTLVNFNDFFNKNTLSMFAEGANGQNKVYSISTEFVTAQLPVGNYYFALYWFDQFNAPYNNFTFKLDPGGKPKSFLEITKVEQAADGRIMEIAPNLPYGTNGIKLIDFIRGVQKKFNLIIYPSKTKQNEFIVETFNNWYRDGEIKDFNKYINLDDKLEVIPANNLAVNELNFGDTLDQDYVSQQFSKEANREYGKQYYVDNQNFFSQGTFDVKTTFASSPLIYLQGTGVSGSVEDINPSVTAYYVGQFQMSITASPLQVCLSSPINPVYTTTGTLQEGLVLYADAYGTDAYLGYTYLVDYNCTIWRINPINGELSDIIGTCSQFGYPCI
jgi:hypothetical protein